MTRRRLLVISHACVTALNQQFFAAVAECGGFDLDLVVPARWRSDFSRRVIRPGVWEADRVKVHMMPVLLAGNIPLHSYAGSMRRLYARLRPDIVYVHHEPYGLATAQAFAARPPGLPMGFYSAQNLVKRYPCPFSTLERRVFREAAFAFPVTQAVEDVLRAKGYHGASVVMPLGFDDRLFTPLGDRERYPVATVGYVGRLVPEKGITTLLDAFKQLPPNVGLAIVGNGPLADQVADLQRRRPNVLWYPDVAHPDVPRYLRGLSLLVLPSLSTATWTEQFGRVLIEAAACGIGTIGSDSGEIPRVIAALEAGQVVPEGDSAALAGAIAQALAAPDMLARWGRRASEASLRFSNLELARTFSSTLHAVLER